MSIEERLERLERKNRRLTGLLAGLGAAAALWVVLGAAPGTAPAPLPYMESVAAKKFLVVDAQGKLRATLCIAEKGPGLWLYDETGAYRAGLGLNEQGAGLTLIDAKGKNRATMCLAEKGPELTLYDENGKTVWAAP